MTYAVSEYQAQRSKAGLGMSLLINGGAIAALILIPSAVIIEQGPDEWKPQPISKVRLTPPPPPEPTPQPEPNTNTVKKIETKVTNPKPIVHVPTNPIIDPGFGQYESDTKAIAPTPVIGSGVDFPISAKPDPVFVGPSLNQRYASGFQPHYPSSLRRQGISGDVNVKVLVGTDGRVKQIQKLDAAHPGFFEATRKQALSKWRFIPATEDGKKVEAWFTISVKFELDDE